MEKYSINGVSLLKNEKAIFPMMGEFHFSRCPEPEWEEEIRKMRACGMDIIATYVFWIHHEEEEGVFDLQVSAICIIFEIVREMADACVASYWTVGAWRSTEWRFTRTGC